MKKEDEKSYFTDAQTIQLKNWRNEFIKEIELLFGDRDPSFKLGEICRAEWGPEAYASNNIINIALHNNIMKNGHFEEELTKWQLAHECVHLLDPVNDMGVANVLEEGLATCFQNNKFGDKLSKNSEYRKPECIVRKYGINQISYKIRYLRGRGVSLKNITIQQLLDEPTKISQKDAEILIKNFQKFKSELIEH